MATELSRAPMLLRCSLQNIQQTDSPLTFNVRLFNIEARNYTKSFNVGGGSTILEYDGNSVNVGDWITNGAAANTYNITEIRNQTYNSFDCTVTDPGGLYSSTTDSGFPVPATDQFCYIFKLNEDNFPILPSGVTGTSDISITWQSDLFSLFAARNSKSQYVSIYQTSATGVTQGKDFVVGESIYIDSSGIFRKSAGSDKISDTVGIVTSKSIPSDDWFSFRPSGKYFDTTVFPNDFFPTPAIIQQVGGNNVTLTAGMKLYVNPNAGRQYTSVAPTSNPYATWIMISATRAIYIAGSGGGGGSATVVTGTVQVFDGGDPTWASAPPEVIYPVLDCGGEILL